MWVSNSTSQRKRIVEVLAHHGTLTAKQLQKFSSPTAKQTSIQSVYKDLRSLESVGVVVRSAGEYSLALPWLLELNEFVRGASELCLARAAERMHLKANEKRSWRFSDLRLLDSFWMELILSSSKAAEQKQVYGWIPHPWFDLLQLGKISRFREQLIASGVRISIIIGGDLPLDREICEAWPTRLYRYSHAKGPFEGQDASYIQIAGDYVVTVTLDAECVTHIERLFQRSRSRSSVDLYSLNRLLVHKMKAKVVLEANPKKVKQLRQKFNEFFG